MPSSLLSSSRQDAPRRDSSYAMAQPMTPAPTMTTSAPAEVADRFRHAYFTVGRMTDDGVVVFEAAALLRLACAQPERDPQGVAAEGLLACAEFRLAAT